jgi:choline dehydrogenase-like flavoprotein
MRRILSAFVALALGLSAATSDKAIHEALFAAYIPVDDTDLKPDLRARLIEARDRIWAAAGQDATFRSLLAPFADLRGLGQICDIRSLLPKSGETAFTNLKPEDQRRVLYVFHSCPANGPRRLVMSLRTFYLARTYGALQEALTGVNLNLYAPQNYIDSHNPALPPTRLRYDASTREVAHKDGVIDYLIVGSGPAGSVLAHELRRGSKRVVLVERGSFTVPGAMETRLINDFQESGGGRYSVDGAILIKNGMAVGGGSLVNVDLCFAPTLPTVQFRIDQWRKEGRIGSEDFTRADLAKAYEWVKSSIGTRVLSESEINTNNRKLWDGALASKLHPKLYDLNTYPPGKSPYPVTDKRSAATELLLSALTDSVNPLSMIPDAEVRRVLFEKGTLRVRGVEVKMRNAIDKPGIIKDPNNLNLPAGKLVTIRARRVILSAGALGSPTILLRSNIPNDQIGRGVVLHASMPVIGKFDQMVDALSGTQASVFVDDFLISKGWALESMSAEPVYSAIMAMGPARYSLETIQAYRNLAGFGVMLIDTPSPENRVRLDAQQEPEVVYALSQADKMRFRQGVAEAARIMFRAGAKQVLIPSDEDLLGVRPSQLEPMVLTNIRQAEQIEKNLQFIPNRSIVTSAHMQATNKLGSNPANSVVGKDLHVWGTEGLYVVDGSVFPTSIGANPMQSIYTFAKLFADQHQ